MAIQFINNQPIDFRASLPSDSNCKSVVGCSNTADFCTPYDIGDPLIFQFKNTPCIPYNVSCNPSLADTNPELVANGSFSTNLNWTFGTGWAWDNINNRAKRTSTSSGTLTQTGLSLTPAGTYRVQFTFTKNVGIAVPMTVALGGTTYSPTILSTGTYTIFITAGAGSSLVFTWAASSGWIDDVSVKQHMVESNNSYCLSSYSPQSWIQDIPGTLRHLPGTDYPLYENLISPSPDAHLQVSISVTGMSAGSLAVNIWKTYPTDGGLLGTIVNNGDYKFYYTYNNFTAGANMQLELIPSIDFDGTIAFNVSDWTFRGPILLEPQSGGNVIVLNQPGVITYDEEYVTVKYDIPIGTPVGTYKVCVFEICGDDLYSPVIEDPDFSGCNWDGLNTICGGGFSFILKVNTPSTSMWKFYPDPWGSYMSGWTAANIDYEIQTGTIDTYGGVKMYLVNDYNGTILATLSTNLQPNTTIYGRISVYADPAGFVPVFRVIQTGAVNVNDVIEFTYIGMVLQQNQSTETCSNCIDIATSHKCSQWVSGDMNQDNGFNFNFSGPFKIAGRVRSMFINPKYKGELQRYADAGGTFTVTRSASNKIYTFLIDYVPERTHDWLRLALLCDEIHIGPTANSGNLWVNTEGDYQPEWPDSLGNFPIAQCRVELQQKTDELYNNNAG